MPAPDLISRAARFFVLAEQASCLGYLSKQFFWNLYASLVVKPAPHLPALTAAVRETDDPGILDSVAFHPLPNVLPPKAVPWYSRLITAWEVHRASSDALFQNPARLALVRLDGCGMPDGHERPSRLPEWLTEARKTASGGWKWPPAWRSYQEMEALAALAAWRPAPRVITPPETLRAWVAFWLERRQSKDPVERGIAAIAILNLPEADLRAASIPPVPATDLLHQVTTAIQAGAEMIYPDHLSLLDWQPITGTTWPVAGVRNVAQAWLESTRHKDQQHRRVAWQQLIRWDLAGSLAICGMDLLPELVKGVQTERDWGVLREMAQWHPTAERLAGMGTPGSLSQLRQLERAWKRHRDSRHFWDRASAWLAGIRLHQAGLASEPPENFLEAYLSSVANEPHDVVLFILAQWFPGTEVPEMWHRNWHSRWQQASLDKHKSIRQTATWALLHRSMEKKPGRSWRCAGLELWRAGAKATSEVRSTLDAAFVRLQEVRAYLAAGEVPDFEGAPAPPAERCRPPLALPPGRIADNEWKMEHEELKMESGKWRMKHQEATPKPNAHLGPDSPSR